MVSLDQLEVFYLVAKHMSFTRAAEQLGITQPAVTRRIEHLEAALHTSLFQRRPGRLSLTEAGSTLLPYAQTIHEAGQNAVQALADQRSGSSGLLRLAAPSMLMARYISPFHELEPDITLILRRGTYEEMVNGIIEGETDVGVFPMSAADPRLDAFPFPGLSREPLVAVVPPKHPLAVRTRLSLAELSREPLVVRGGMFFRELTEEWALKRGAKLRFVAEAPSSDDVKQLVMAGVGVGILPWMGVEQDVRAGLMRAMALEDGSLTIGLYVLTVRDRRPSPATKKFLEYLRTLTKLDLPAPGQTPTER